MVLEEFKSTPRNKQGQKEIMYNGNNIISMRETKNNLNSYRNLRFDDSCPPDLFTHPHLNNNNNRNQVYNKNILLDPLKKQINNQNININTYVINKKEAKKYEDLLKYNANDLQINVNSNIQNTNSVKPSKNGKVILDPINNNLNININNNKKDEQTQSKKNFYPTKNKKMEVSFKATLKFTDEMGNNNKFEFSPNINVHNQN